MDEWSSEYSVENELHLHYDELGCSADPILFWCSRGLQIEYLCYQCYHVSKFVDRFIWGGKVLSLVVHLDECVVINDIHKTTIVSCKVMCRPLSLRDPCEVSLHWQGHLYGVCNALFLPILLSYLSRHHDLTQVVSVLANGAFSNDHIDNFTSAHLIRILSF